MNISAYLVFVEVFPFPSRSESVVPLKGDACQNYSFLWQLYHFSIINTLRLCSPPTSCTRPAADNLQHPGHYLHRRQRPEATLPGPALRPLLQRPQSPQHGRRGPRQHQGERQRAAGGRRAGQQGRSTHHHLGAAGDVHHLYRDHHHALHHDHPQTALTTHYSGKTDGRWETRGDVWATHIVTHVSLQGITVNNTF